MDPRRFDGLAKALVGGLPRRQALRRVTGGGLAALAALRVGHGPAAAGQEEQGTLTLPCRPCRCANGERDCCLIGITGGGLVRTEAGDTNLVLFATRIEAADSEQATGFVRWVDPGFEDTGLTLESVGSITYGWVEGDEQARTVRGTMQVNGDEQPFVLQVVDAGPDNVGKDTAALAVGDEVAEGEGGTGFGYKAEGTLVGGDLQLLDSAGGG